ncbi:hypothetical protein [Bradyrhizobium glycinis]|uniref:hypothetical protein n=1 Tax=Bradyrhizobium glycinis TaxID=2751812 RepID=UPI0018D60F7F|nr:hypothetical protein [Bradyrhizobium glycinis]MBH5372264.1 hypothetical protein [Bradyrhizobium glycinis]
MKQQTRKNDLFAVAVLITSGCLVPGNGAGADPLIGGADPNLQSRIEQTSPGAAERLLNNLRENPPPAPSKKSTRPHSSHQPHGSEKKNAR